MKHKLFVAMLAIAFISAELFAVKAFAQTALDPTQSGAFPKYPFYLDHSCGDVTMLPYEDNGLVVRYRATTMCPGSGRISKPTIYLNCWEITFGPDLYT